MNKKTKEKNEKTPHFVRRVIKITLIVNTVLTSSISGFPLSFHCNSKQMFDRF